MTMIVEETTVGPAAGSGITPTDWCAIIAGAVVAAAISLTLLSFGTALGLTLTGRSMDVSPMGVMIAVGLWLVFVQVTGFFGGGYISGRMRRRTGEGTPHESEIRDGTHGLIVWGLSTLIVAAGTAAAAALGTLAGATAATAVASTPVEYYADKLLRHGDASPAATDATTGAGSTAGTGTATSTAPATPPAAASPETGQDLGPVRTEASRILTRAMTGKPDPEDRAYLGRMVSRATGLSEDQALARFDQSVAAARDAADKARKTGILYAFLTAASLLVGALAAWWAAIRGGVHRDEGTDFSRLTRWS